MENNRIGIIVASENRALSLGLKILLGPVSTDLRRMDFYARQPLLDRPLIGGFKEDKKALFSQNAFNRNADVVISRLYLHWRFQDKTAVIPHQEDLARIKKERVFLLGEGFMATCMLNYVAQLKDRSSLVHGVIGVSPEMPEPDNFLSGLENVPTLLLFSKEDGENISKATHLQSGAIEVKTLERCGIPKHLWDVFNSRSCMTCIRETIFAWCG